MLLVQLLLALFLWPTNLCRMAADGDNDQVEGTGEDIFYVGEDSLKELKAKISADGEITAEMVKHLTSPEDVPDDCMMVPVDMRGVGEEFEDVEQMLEKLGPKGVAEAFLKARAFFEENPDKVPEGDRAKPMTSAMWRAVLDEDAGGLGEGEEEEAWGEGAEEEACGAWEGEEEEMVYNEEAEEEVAEGEAEEDEEPAAKKAKTD